MAAKKVKNLSWLLSSLAFIMIMMATPFSRVATPSPNAAAYGLTAASIPTQTFSNGPQGAQTVLFDTSGQRIDAHDGHIYFFGNRYYWYGTSYQCGFNFTVPSSHYCGVKVYESFNLKTWQYDGFALPPSGSQTAWDNACGGATFGCYRPKVAYNAATHQYVMWLNESLGDQGAGYFVLTSPTPAGPYNWAGHRTLSFTYCPTAGNVFRYGDEDLFVDDDGTAYIAYTVIDSCGGNAHHLVVEKLDSGYLNGTGQRTLYTGTNNNIEAPALFKRGSTYYMMYSDPMCAYCNSAHTSYATATSPLGNWQFRGDVTPTSPGGQPMGVTPIAANGTLQYLFTLDRWDNGNANEYKANYFFAPLSFAQNGAINTIPPVNTWQSRIQSVPPPAYQPLNTIAAGAYTPLITPQRIVDSRYGLGGLSGQLQANHSAYSFAIPGNMTASGAIALNLTAVNASGNGDFRVWGAGPMPANPNLTFGPGRSTTSNMAVVQPDSSGAVHIYAEGANADALVDIQGYYAAGSSYVPLAPAVRGFDSRSSNRYIAPNSYIDIAMNNSALPASARSITADLTVTNPNQSATLQVYDPAQPRPSANVNVVYGPGVTTSLAMLPVTSNGTLRFYNSSSYQVGIAIDFQGYDNGSATTLFSNPIRLEHPLTGAGYYTQLFQSQLTYQFDTRSVGVPSTAKAVIVVVAASTSPGGYIQLFADQNAAPATSNINLSSTAYQSNLAIVPLNNGMLDSYMYSVNGVPVDMSLDVVGYVN